MSEPHASPSPPTPEVPPAADPLGQVRAQLRPGTRVRTTGLQGAARGHLLARLSRELRAPLVCITADEDSAEQLAADLAFFLGGAGSLVEPNVLQLPGDEVLPWDELTPDAAVVAERLGALFHLAPGHAASRRWCSRWRALHKRVLPPDVLDRLSARWSAWARSSTATRSLRRLAADGLPVRPRWWRTWARSPSRGGIIDVFCPLYAGPIRVELFGDTVESLRALRPGDPAHRRARSRRLTLVPAREVLFTERHAERSRGRRPRRRRAHRPPHHQAARDARPHPRGHPRASGWRRCCPGFFEGGLATVLDYLPLLVARAAGLPRRSARARPRRRGALQRRSSRSRPRPTARKDLALPPEEHFLSDDELRAGARAATRCSRAAACRSRPSEAPPVAFTFGTTAGPARRPSSATTARRARSPRWWSGSQRWREMRVAAAIACGTRGPGGPAEAAAAGPQRHGAGRTTSRSPDSPALLRPVHLRAPLHRRGEPRLRGRRAAGSRCSATRRSSASARAGASRARKRADAVRRGASAISRKATSSSTPTSASAATPGLTKMEVQGVPGDFLVLEYAGQGQDLPAGEPDAAHPEVHRRRPDEGRARQAGRARAGRRPRSGSRSTCSRWRPSCSSSTPRARRTRAIAFTAPDRYFRQFEADFEFEETPDQAKAIEDVLADMQKPSRWTGWSAATWATARPRWRCAPPSRPRWTASRWRCWCPPRCSRSSTSTPSRSASRTTRSRSRWSPRHAEAARGARGRSSARTEGKVDILIGTHKLLGGDVAFKDLGLLVVDEEQRFGVKQKEQLKQLRDPGGRAHPDGDAHPAHAAHVACPGCAT